MDQITLFQSSEADVYAQLKPKLLNVLMKNWADDSLLTFEERKNYCSVLFDGSVVARLRAGKRPYIEFPANGQEISDGKEKNGFIKIKLDDLSLALGYGNCFEKSLQAIIDAIPKEFSCCSRYMECSNEIKCLNPDKEMSMRCGYRKVLMSGKVFYGVNRNIE